MIYTIDMWDKILHRYLKWPYTLAYQEYSSVKKPRYTIVFIHGIGSSSKMWESIAKKCPNEARVIAVDLLGFGASPKPSWKAYSSKTHTDSLITTLLMLRVTGPMIIVGHSLGALVAVEFTRRFGGMVKSLILCSPPFYNSNRQNERGINAESILKSFYKSLNKNPKNARRILALASKYNYINAGFKVDDTNIASYLATLEASIVNQTAMNDACKLKQPTSVLLGRLDLFVIAKNIKTIVRKNPNVQLQQFTAGHEINSLYAGKILSSIRQVVEQI